jgi:hypothetical protein
LEAAASAALVQGVGCPRRDVSRRRWPSKACSVYHLAEAPPALPWPPGGSPGGGEARRLRTSRRTSLRRRRSGPSHPCAASTAEEDERRPRCVPLRPSCWAGKWATGSSLAHPGSSTPSGAAAPSAVSSSVQSSPALEKAARAVFFQEIYLIFCRNFELQYLENRSSKSRGSNF